MSTEDSNAPIGSFEASGEFAALFGGEPAAEQNAPAAVSDDDAALAQLESDEAGDDAEPNAQEEGDDATDDSITVEVDGKPVVLTKAQIAEAHKGQLRQADYTQKTMAAAEETKAARAEREAATNERQQYAAQLQTIQAQLQGVLQEQSNIDWQQLLDTDPVEYLKQQHLYTQRQAALQNTQAEQQKVEKQQQAEQAKSQADYLHQQHQLLTDKLPEWKDEAKRSKAVAELSQELLNRGFTQQELKGLTDHRLVLEFNDAKKYRELVARAKNATTKVAKLPTKVERPGNGQAGKPDGRSAAMQRFNKTGSQQDAANVFAQMFS